MRQRGLGLAQTLVAAAMLFLVGMIATDLLIAVLRRSQSLSAHVALVNDFRQQSQSIRALLQRVPPSGLSVLPQAVALTPVLQVDDQQRLLVNQLWVLRRQSGQASWEVFAPVGAMQGDAPQTFADSLALESALAGHAPQQQRALLRGWERLEWQALEQGFELQAAQGKLEMRARYWANSELVRP